MSTFDSQAFYQSLEGKPGRSGCMLWGMGLGALIFLGLAVGAFMFPEEGSRTAMIVFLVFGALFLLGFLYSFKPYDPSKDPVLKEVKQGGNHIVWIYPHEQTVNGFTSYWVKFMNKNGQTTSIPTVQRDNQERVIAGLAQLYPDAEVGYSDSLNTEMRARYKK